MSALNFETESIHDFQLYPSRKPKILVQTAAHVAGVVQYFHKSKLPLKIQEDLFAKESVSRVGLLRIMCGQVEALILNPPLEIGRSCPSSRLWRLVRNSWSLHFQKFGTQSR